MATQTDVGQLMQTGIACHQAGRWAEAETLYRQVLASVPQHTDALHLLGLLAHHAGNNEAAVSLIRQAIDITPGHAPFHSNLGNALLALGRYDEAIRSYERAIEINPDLPDAYLNLGNALQRQGRITDAIRSHQRALALRPDHAESHYNLGSAFTANGQLDEARKSYERALAIRPRYAEAKLGLGIALQSQDRLEEALACYQQALDIKPDFAEAHNNIGLIRAAQFRHDEAIECIRKALDIRPDYAEAHQNIGAQYEAKGMLDEALRCYRKSVALKPDLAMAHNNIGNALLGLGDLQGSLAAYEKALALNPDLCEAHSNLGNLLQTMGRLDEAIRCADRALALRPEAPDVLWNKAFALLLKGDFERGWPLAEVRWQLQDPQRNPCRFSQPLWLGDALVSGCSVLLHHEQGLGDTLQMLRYVPLLAERGAHVLVMVPAALAGVAAKVPGVSAVVIEGGELPPFDLHCPFMSLPLAFGTTLQSVPASIPYLFAPQVAGTAWRERLEPRGRPRVGLVWSGSTAHRNDQQRSIPLETLLPCLDAEADFISIQNEYRPADLRLMQETGRVRDFAAELKDFSDTAALIEQLDLVISVDTAVAHLAGGMGKPTWLLLPFAPDYRWLLGRQDSPWYPTMRLVRQPRFNDWVPVINEIRRMLTAELPALVSKIPHEQADRHFSSNRPGS